MFKKLARKVKDSQEKGSREKVIEELFNDFNRSRFQVYKMNFVRGIFFGFGSVVGGTIVVTFFVLSLNLFVDLPGGVGNFIESVQESIKQSDSTPTE